MVNQFACLFLFSLSLHCFVSCLTANTKNITTDQYALLAFKSLITSDPYNTLANNWSTSSSVCSWVGITCDERHGRVHSLILQNMGLRGTISPKLGNLSFLVILDISNNSFGGEFPRELCWLRRLKTLDLHYNEFVGGIPTALGDLSQLQYLYLGANNFSGFIPQSIGNLRRLKILKIGMNKLSGLIPQTVSNMSSLEYIGLYSNYFSGEIPKGIFGDLTQLRTVVLQYILKFNNSLFQDLYLSYNNLTGNLPSNICQGLPNLRIFDLYHNDLSGDMPTIWHQCEEMEELHLSYNGFNKGPMPGGILNMPKLRQLYLSGNNMEGKIPSLNNMTSLRVVKFGYNNLNGRLPNDFFNQLPQLENFTLNNNQIEGSIPRSIGNCTSLIYFDLSSNFFTVVRCRGRGGKIIRIGRNERRHEGVRCRGRGGKIIRIGRNELRHEVVRDQPAVHQAQEQLINQEVEQHGLVAVEEHMDQDVEQPAQRYMGGPYDLSVLTRYEVHVARRLWYGQERGTKKHLKVPSHGKKLEDWVPPQLPPLVQGWLNGSGLSALQRSSMKMVDANLLSAFVERWHPETSSFHMPFGEMTITLYDVACLLHVPVRGDFYDQPSGLSEEEASRLAVDLLGVSYDVAKAETARNRGGYYRQEWLYDLFKRHRQTGMLDCGARAYMMLLVGCTIFADKSFSLVDAKYLPLFRNLSNCGRFCWGAAALVTLYEYLGDGSMFTTKQLGGYATLLQCWIHEYFPTLGNRAENQFSCDQPGGGFPRAMRWKYKQGTLKVDQIRRLIDDLTPTDVIWRPFQSHSRVVPFDKICLYSGCLRWYDTVVPYLPERCIRQFGYIQDIPPPPPDRHAFDVGVEWIDYHSSVHRVVGGASLVTYPYEVTNTYMEWYYRVSHPRLIRPNEDPHRPVPVPTYRVPDDAGPSDPRMSLIASKLQDYLDAVGATKEESQFEHLYEALDLTHGGPLP